jgi:XisH protein
VAKDLFHQVVKDALIKDGWNITHDPFPVDYGDVQMQIDLGAERLLAATKDKIIIEEYQIYLIVYDVEDRSIVKWTN